MVSPFKAVQGLGGGGILSVVSIIMADLVPLKERGLYNGLTGMLALLPQNRFRSLTLAQDMGCLLRHWASCWWSFSYSRTVEMAVL